MQAVDSKIEPLKARRLYLLVRESIVGGQLAPGSRLPTEAALVAEHGVSRVTVRRALDMLAGEGLIVRRAGSGTFVSGKGGVRPMVADLSNVLSHLADMGRSTSVRLMSFAYVTPGETVAEGLRLGPGERVQCSVRIRLIDGEPFSHLTTHVPEAIGRTYSEEELSSRPLLELLERSGVSVMQASQTIGATLAGPVVAEALEVEIGSPLLSLTRVVYGPSGEGLEYLQALYRPDRYAFQMELRRAGDDGARHWSPVAPDFSAAPFRTSSPVSSLGRSRMDGAGAATPIGKRS